MASVDYTERDVVNHIIRGCSKLAQMKYKTRHDWVGKVIHWELCKRLNFNHITKWYINKQESIFEKLTHRILWDFQIQTDHLIPTRKPEIRLIKKGIWCFGGLLSKKNPAKKQVKR